MTNPYYNGGSFPATGSPATSASMRAELSAVTAGFDKLPILSGNASKLVVVNGSASALEATGTMPPLAVPDSNLVIEDNADNTRKFRFEASGITAGATRVLTVPDANLTLVGEATTQTLTNKTLNLASNTLVATSAQIAAAVTDETGSGALVFGTSPTISGATLTGGSLNNTPIGGSTPNTGAFTTLSASSTVTFSANPILNAGAANGVLYLNGSKVATSGSALTFDGTNLTSTVGPFRSTVSTIDSIFGSGSFVSGTLGIGTVSNHPITFNVNLNEQMRLTSTGLGIGTSSPGARLNTESASIVQALLRNTNAASYTSLRLYNDQNSAARALELDYAGSTYASALLTGGPSGETAAISTTGLYPLVLGTNANARVTIAAGGDVGIGTSSPVQRVSVQRGAAAGNGIAINLNNPHIYGTGVGTAAVGLRFNRTPNDAGSTGVMADIYGGNENESSSTAGYLAFATRFGVSEATTEHMRLTSAGNLGIGTSSPAYKLVVSNGGASGIEFGPAFSGTSNLIQSYNRSGAAYVNTIYDAAEHRFNISGSEALRLNSSGNLGLGVTPSYKLDISAPNDSTARVRLLTTTGYNILWSSNTGGGSWLATEGSAGGALLSTAPAYASVITSIGANPICFGTNTTERMRLDSSGNLGIGTSSPDQKLHLYNASGNIYTRIQSAADNNVGLYLTNSQRSWLWSTVGGGNGAMMLYDLTGTKEVARFDTSGNLGLGVTPSAWISGYRAIDLGLTGAVYGRTDSSIEVSLAANAYRNSAGNWIYKQTAIAGQFGYDTTGAWSWKTAPSGTAGNAISFTQSMTLDASGNLGVGVTSMSRRFQVQAATTGSVDSISWTDGATDTGYLGTVAGGGTRIWAGGFLAFGSGGGTSYTERARITSGGALLVGNSASIGSEIALFKQTAGTGSPVTRTWNSETTGNNEFIEFGTEGTYTTRGSITYNRAGGLVAYNTTSDYRAKDIIGPVQNTGATIDALKVYEGKMKGATQSRPMLVAHEAQAVAPYAVSGVKDEVNEDGTPKFQQIDVSSLVPLLLAEIQSLRARVAALESN